MTNLEEELKRKRKDLKAKYATAFDRLSAILFAEDPVGINYCVNTDEYEPEVGTILPRLRGCGGPEDVQRVISQEFTYWFDSSAHWSFPMDSEVARRVWEEVVPLLEPESPRPQP